MAVSPRFVPALSIAAVLLVGCGSGTGSESGEGGAAPVAAPSPTSKPEAAGMTQQATEAARETVETVKEAARETVEQSSDAVTAALNREVDRLDKRLEGLNMAAGFINDEQLSELIDQFSGMLDELHATMKSIKEAPADQLAQLQAQARAFIDELKTLDRQVNERVKSLRP